MIGSVAHFDPPPITPDKWESDRAAKMREISDFLGRATNQGSRRSPVYCVERPDLNFPTCQAAADWLGVKHSQQVVVAIKRCIALRGFHFQYVGRPAPQINRLRDRRVARVGLNEREDWSSISEASRATGLTWATISGAIKRKRLFPDGSRWVYLNGANKE